MKYQDESQPKNLFLKVWIAPIRFGGLFQILDPMDWHTLTALCLFINDKGECNPSLGILASVLGLRNIASISRRIGKLEKKRYDGYPIIEVKRVKKARPTGGYAYTNNCYVINQKIISIFNDENDPGICGQNVDKHPFSDIPENKRAIDDS